jgi:GTPase
MTTHTISTLKEFAEFLRDRGNYEMDMDLREEMARQIEAVLDGQAECVREVSRMGRELGTTQAKLREAVEWVRTLSEDSSRDTIIAARAFLAAQEDSTSE